MPHATARQVGLTLVELMISIALGLLVVMVATALLVSTKSGYTQQDEGARVEETGRYALEIVTRALHQVAYEDWDADGSPMIAGAEFAASIQGLDKASVGQKATSIESPLSTSVNGSDVLAVRYFGAGSAKSGDGTVLNCAGFGVPAPASYKVADTSRGWSIFQVLVSSAGEPELYCKYVNEKNEWNSAAIATGVESFQVLYGVDTDGDDMPNTYLNATGVDLLDKTLTLDPASAGGLVGDKNRKTYWKKIAVIKIGLLVRASSLVSTSTLTEPFDLFGKDYGAAHDESDPGVRLEQKDFPASTRNRVRKVFTQTIQLRNKSAGGGA